MADGRDGHPGSTSDDAPTSDGTPLPERPGRSARNATLEPGTVLARRYAIVRFLARGGMGEVYEARDTKLGIAVALKTIRPEVAHDPRALERFKREILLARSLSHPGLCRTFDLGEDDALRPPLVFLTMELLAGETLAARLKRVGRLAPGEAIGHARQMAAALQAAHAAGVVHRDIKSANVFVVPGSGGERAVLTDFGLAREVATTDLEAHKLTHDGAMLGTPAYMAPEQVRGQPAGPAADIYALGLVLFEMVSGRLPFAGGNVFDVASRRLLEDPPVLATVVLGVEPWLSDLTARCLARDPRDRFASAADLSTALEAGLAGAPAARVSRDSAGVQAAGTSSPPAPGLRTAGRWGRVLALAGGAVALLLAAALGLRLLPARPAPPSARPAVIALPCQVLGGAESAFLADAIPGTLSAFLSKLPGLDTRRPPSSLQVDPAKADLKFLASAYGVGRCVTCAVTVEAGRLLLTVQLVEPQSGRLQWSEVYDGSREDYLALLRRAADGLRAVLVPGSAMPGATRTGVVASATELALRLGRHHSDRYKRLHLHADYEAARAALDRALDLEPTLAEAAGERAVLEANRGNPDEMERWGRRTLELDQSSTSGWFALASAANTRGEIRRSIAFALEGIRSEPNATDLLYSLGNQCSTLCLVASRRCTELAPLYTQAYSNAATSLLELGRPEEALGEIEKVLRIEPDQFDARNFRVFALVELGRLREARQVLPPVGPDSPQYAEMPHLVLDLAGADAVPRRRARERVVELLASARMDADAGYHLLYHVPPALARAGDVDLALGVVQSAIDKGQVPYYDWLMLNPSLEPLRRRPEFAAIQERSRAKFLDGLAAFADGRARGELPEFLDQTLADLCPRLGLAWPPPPAT